MSTITKLFGQFECKIDDKNRIILPAKLKKQLPPAADGKFTIINGIDKCLEMYPQNEWDVIVDEINTKDLFDIDTREFIHHFYVGNTAAELDSQNRILLPKDQFSYAGIDKEIILFAYKNRIEIWDKTTFNDKYGKKPDNYAELAQRVMGKKQNQPEKHPGDVS